MGQEPFRFILSDPPVQNIPKILETDKGEADGEPWDVVNLRTLRDLVKSSALACHPPRRERPLTD